MKRKATYVIAISCLLLTSCARPPVDSETSTSTTSSSPQNSADSAAGVSTMTGAQANKATPDPGVPPGDAAAALADPAAAKHKLAFANPVERMMNAITHVPAPPERQLVTGSFDTKDKLLPVKQGEPVAEFWQARGEDGKFGGTLTVSTFGPGPKTFNYWQASEVESSGLGQLMFEPLVGSDPWTAQLEPRLAKSVTVSPDHKEYTFVLRQGLKWSDGQPITADDVVYTFDTIIKKGYGNSSFRDTITVRGEFPSIKKVDDLTVVMKTTEPFAPFLMNLRSICIAPKHAMEAITNKPMDDFHGFWDINGDPSKLVVSGPFKVSRYVPGQRIELSRNPLYSVVDKQGRRLPYLDRFTVLVVPDQNTELLKFYGEEIDFLDIRAVRGSDAALMKQREKNSDFKMYNLGPDDGVNFLMFNMNRRKAPKTGKFYVEPKKQKWFNNQFFRQAVNVAIDRDRVVNNALRGVGVPLFTCESPASMYVNKNLKPFPPNVEKAEQLLKQGGFIKKEDKLYDADGNFVEFTLTTNAGNTARDATCLIIQDTLKELGMKVNYQPIDWNILIDKVETSLEWESVMMALTGDKLEPYAGANVWKTNSRMHMFDQRLQGPDGTTAVTDARDWEKDIDTCFDRGATTFDTDSRRKFYDRYQQIVFDQVPYVYLFAILDVTAMRNKFGNYMPTPWGIDYTPRGSLHNIEEIYVRGSHK